MLLKVMTFNLLHAGAVSPAGHWTARSRLAVDVLKSGAEIIGLQEATAVQIKHIECELPEFAVVPGPESGERRLPHYVRAAVRMLRRAEAPETPSALSDSTPPGDQAEMDGCASPPLAGPADRREHCAILYDAERFDAVDGSAFWLSHQPHQPGSALRGTWHPRVVNWVRLRDRSTSREVSIYNAHLDFLPWAPARSARILRQFLDAHWDGSAQILLGDFNAANHSAAYRYLSREGEDRSPPLADTWLSAKEWTGPEGTFHGGTGRPRWPGRLDRIFCRPAPLVEKHTTITHHLGRTYPSDHFPVVAELRFQ